MSENSANHWKRARQREGEDDDNELMVPKTMTDEEIESVGLCLVEKLWIDRNFNTKNFVNMISNA